MAKKSRNITKSKGFKLAIGLSASVVAIGATCGLAVGLSAASNTGYVDITPDGGANMSNKVTFAPEGTKDSTTWNVGCTISVPFKLTNNNNFTNQSSTLSNDGLTVECAFDGTNFVKIYAPTEQGFKTPEISLSVIEGFNTMNLGVDNFKVSNDPSGIPTPASVNISSSNSEVIEVSRNDETNIYTLTAKGKVGDTTDISFKIIFAEPLNSTSTMNDLKNKETLPEDDYHQRFGYSEIVGNGPDTSILDKSFHQSAYYAQTYWVHANCNNDTKTGWTYQQPAFDYDKFPLDSVSGDNNEDESVFSSVSMRPSGTSPNDFANTYKAAYEAGKKSLVLPGYQHITPLSTLKAGDENIYKSMGYILIDSEVSDPNIASVQFKAEQSAFLCGVAACQYLEENWEEVYQHANDGQLAVGCFGGQNIITVTCFMGGLELGVWFYNNYILPNTDFYKNADEKEKEKRTVKFISLGNKSSYFSGTFVIGDAKLIAQELLAKGACAVMAVAGPQTGDVVTEIVAQRSPCRVLGVDSAMENGDWGKYMSTSNLFKEETPVVLCSAEKNVAQLTAQILDNIWSGQRISYPMLQVGKNEEQQTQYDHLEDGKKISDLQDLSSRMGAVGTVGYTSIGNMYNTGVNLSTAGQSYLIRALKYIDDTFSKLEDNDYQGAIELIVTQPLPYKKLDNGYEIKEKTILNIINENRYFIF